MLLTADDAEAEERDTDETRDADDARDADELREMLDGRAAVPREALPDAAVATRLVPIPPPRDRRELTGADAIWLPTGRPPCP